MNPFSYDEYKQIISHIKKHLPLKDYSDISVETEAFCILRHDVEFIPERALNLAKLESNELKVKSSYFFQLRNACYNILSEENIELIHKIHNLGHKIGLHVHIGGLKSQNKLSDYINYIKRDIQVMSEYLELPIDRYSYHRPPSSILALNLEIPGLINVYSTNYFHYYSGKRPQKLNVVYLADSMHRWNYGHPLDVLNQASVSKCQLLTHPFSWTRIGYDNLNNFKSLIKSKTEILKKNIQSEFTHFPHELIDLYDHSNQ